MVLFYYTWFVPCSTILQQMTRAVIVYTCPLACESKLTKWLTHHHTLEAVSNLCSQIRSPPCCVAYQEVWKVSEGWTEIEQPSGWQGTKHHRTLRWFHFQWFVQNEDVIILDMSRRRRVGSSPILMMRWIRVLLHSYTKLDVTQFTFVYRCGRTLFSLHLEKMRRDEWRIES